MEELYDCNHNVYRLNPKGEIVWQLIRDDSILPIDIWKVRHELAKEEGSDGYRKPFTYIKLEYPDGRIENTDKHGDGTNILTWETGCIIHLSGQQNNYVLDPNTGIATNIAKSSLRYWDVERIYMPNGDKIVLKYSKSRREPREPYYEANYNLLRLNSEGKVIWHIKKDDSFMLDWWEKHQQLRFNEYDEEYDPEYKYTPFSSLVIKYKDGSQSITDEHGDGTNIITWKFGCIIYLNVMENTYVLDPESGIVTNEASILRSE